ncbi:hypothetical protein Pelo_8246 [Pelomyxa schiedti]|nr:hypothetical protein Pelo_8246 [Pelomyxa schiedti]
MRMLQEISLFKCQVLKPMPLLSLVAKTEGSVQQLNLTECYDLDTGSLSTLCGRLPHAKQLVFSRCGVDDTVLRVIGKTCLSLKSIFLTGCSRITPEGLLCLGSCISLEGISFPATTNDEALVHLSKHLLYLLVANMAGARHVTGVGIASLVLKCSLLRTLNISDCRAIDDTAFCMKELEPVAPAEPTAPEGAEVPETVAEPPPQPSTSSSSIIIPLMPAPEESINHPIECPPVQHASYSQCPPMVPPPIWSLRILNAQCVPLTDTAITSIAKHCPGLVNIDLSHNGLVTDVGVSVLSRRCPLLATVVLQQCTQITDVALHHLAVARADFSIMTTVMETSRLRESTTAAESLNEDGVCRMKMVDVFGCALVTTAGVLELIGKRPIEHINCSQAIQTALQEIPGYPQVLNGAKVFSVRSNF